VGFESPWMLLGLAAAAVPVALHLLHRRHARRVPFAALEFLLSSDKRLARRMRLKQLLVLALRVALVAALALALAKPYVQRDAPVADAVGRPGLVALVIDDSASMSARPEGADETLLDRALARARALAEAAGPQTHVAVVTAGRPAQARTPKATLDRAEVARALGQIHPTEHPGDLPGALRAAERALAAAAADLDPSAGPLPEQIFVLSDQAAHAWAHLGAPWAALSPPAVRLLDLRDGADLGNQAVLRVDYDPTSRQALVEVGNFSSSPQDLQVTVTVDEAEATSTVAVPAGARRTAELTLPPSAGGEGLGRARVVPGGALVDDDERFFKAQRTTGLRVGLVDGAPRDVSYLDELFFLDAALRHAGDDGGARITPAWLAPEDLATAELASFDVIVLANPPPLSRDQALPIRAFVEEGGGVLITCGDNAHAQRPDQLPGTSGGARPGPATPRGTWDGGLLGLAPLPLRSVKTVAARDDPAAAVRALTVGRLAPGHPLTEDLRAMLGEAAAGNARGGLGAARIYSYCLLDAQARPGVQVLAQLTNGAPLLVARGEGRGRVLQWTTTIDRDWTDLPVRPVFVPLVDRLVLWLAGRLGGGAPGSAGDADGRGLRVGDVLRALPPSGEGPLELEGPDGSRRPIAEPAPGEPAALGRAELTGFYTLSRKVDAGTRPTPPVTLAVNGDPAESDLTPADLDAVRAALAGEPAGAPPPSAVAHGVGARSSAGRAPHRGLWGGLLLALFALLAAEGWVALRG